MTALKRWFSKAYLSKLYHDERGLSFVLVSVGMACLVGMAALVTDFGLLALNQQRLHNAVDAAALAGAQELALNNGIYREIQASNAAEAYAAQNHVEAPELKVTVNGNTVSAEAVRTVDFILARILGVESGQAQARAAAAAGALTSVTGIAPLTIREGQYKYGQLYTLKYGSPQEPESFESHGNFGALALDGRGASNYEEYLKKGYSGTINIGQKIDTEPGNMNGPTQGIDDRLAQCTDGCTFDSFKPGCPRVLIIPTHQETDLQGRDQIKVTGFAAFFADRTAGDDDEIIGYFVKMVGEGDIDLDQPIQGMYGVKLIE